MVKYDLDLIKAKVQAFRVAEAKDVLQQLGMSRSGIKADLIARILNLFQDAAALNASGYRPRDSSRQELAVSVIEKVHKDQEAQGHVSWNHRRLIIDLEQKAAAAAKSGGGGGGGGGSGASATTAAGGPAAKRLRVDGGATAAAAAGKASGLQDGPAVNDVIKAFLNGTDALSNTKVRCICADHTDRGQMLQCEGAFCGVWQHASCVRQHMRSTAPPPGRLNSASRQQYYCERCRVARADPFWEVFDATVMPPAVADTSVRQTVVMNALGHQVQVAVHTTGLKYIMLAKSNLMLLRAKPHEYKLMALCLQLDDKVPFRIHWPLHASLSFEASNGALINNIRPSQRVLQTKLGINQRDEGYDLRHFLPMSGGTNAAGMMRKGIQLELADPDHTHLLLVYLMRRRSKEQVKALMKPPEQLAQAVQRICRHMRAGHKTTDPPDTPAAAAAAANPTAAAAVAGGGGGGNNADGVTIDSDDDDDDEIILGNIVVSLRDPMSGARMTVPVRFTDTAGTAPSAFDLDTFLEMAQRSKKWLDPHNQEASTVQNLQVDSYLAHILTCLQQVPEVKEVEINSDGLWRPAGSSSAFMSVLEQQKDLAAAAAQAAAAAATVGQAGGGAAAAAAGGNSDHDDDDHSDDDKDELKQAMAEFASSNEAAKAARAAEAAASRRAKPAAEVIDLCSDDDDDDDAGYQERQAAESNTAHSSAAAAAAATTAPLAAAAGAEAVGRALNPIQQGLRIRLPVRQPQQQQQLQPGQQQQQYSNVPGQAHGSIGPGQHDQRPGGGVSSLAPGLVQGSNPQQQQQHAGMPGQLLYSTQMQSGLPAMQLGAPTGPLGTQGLSVPVVSLAVGPPSMQQQQRPLGVSSSGYMQQQQQGGYAGTQIPLGSMPMTSMPAHGAVGVQYGVCRPFQQVVVVGQQGPAAFVPQMLVQQQQQQQQRPVYQQQHAMHGQQSQQNVQLGTGDWGGWDH